MESREVVAIWPGAQRQRRVIPQPSPTGWVDMSIIQVLPA